MDVRRLTDLIAKAKRSMWGKNGLLNEKAQNSYIADYLIAHGVTSQDDMTELIGRGLDNINCSIYGADKEFNEKMAGYNPSSFCAGFQYAISLAKGLLTQLPKPPKGERNENNL